MSEDLANDENKLLERIDLLSANKKSEKQFNLLLAFISLIREQQLNYHSGLKKSDLIKKANVSSAVLRGMIKNKILLEKNIEKSRLIDFDSIQKTEEIKLSPVQEKKLAEIKTQFETFDTVLLHGITGSGKTEIYIKMIDEVLSQGKQVLYLLPEIALTSQIINRLRKFFGHKVGVYHSRFNEYERVEIWNRVLHFGEEEDDKYSLILGARSSLLLPYHNLGLIIVDE